MELEQYQIRELGEEMNNQAEACSPPIFKRDIERLAQQLFVRSADTTPPGKYCAQEELNEFNLRKMKDCFRVAEQFIKYKNSL